MKRNDNSEISQRLFRTSNLVSHSRPWFISLFDCLCDSRRARTNPQPANVTAEPVPVPEIWMPHRTSGPRMLSLAMHAVIVLLIAIPAAVPPKPLPKSVVNVALYTPVVSSIEDKSRGGGGGGKHMSIPASLGKSPRASDKQFVPPDPEPTKNLDPTLIVEPTVVAPQLASLPPVQLFTLGDPNGLPGPPSAGFGTGYGIGTGHGHGIGEGDGAGVGPGENGGVGGGPFIIGGGVTAPVLLMQVLPEYSEEARKVRYQGTVVLDTIVLADGSVRVIRVARSIGFGLDEKAIEAVLKWKFQPGRKNGNPVPVALNVQVNFNLR